MRCIIVVIARLKTQLSRRGTIKCFNTIVPLATTTRIGAVMGSKSLRYFRYMLKSQPGNLLPGFAVPAIILKSTAIHSFLHQLAQRKNLPRYFPLPFDYLCVPAVAAQPLIIIFKAFCDSSLLASNYLWQGKWYSYFRALSPEILVTTIASIFCVRVKQ